jgi:hypothetical protein
MGINKIESRSTSKRALIIFLILAALGLLIGYCLRRLSNGPTPDSTPRSGHASLRMTNEERNPNDEIQN